MAIVINHSNDVGLLSAVAAGGMQAYADRRGDIAAARDQAALGQIYANRRAQAASRARALQSAYAMRRRSSAPQAPASGVQQFRNPTYWGQDQRGNFLPTAANPIVQRQQEQQPVQQFRNPQFQQSPEPGSATMSVGGRSYGIGETGPAMDLATQQPVAGGFSAPGVQPQAQRPSIAFAQQTLQNYNLPEPAQRQIATYVQTALASGLSDEDVMRGVQRLADDAVPASMTPKQSADFRFRELNNRQRRVSNEITDVRDQLIELDIDPDAPSSQIVPLIDGDEQKMQAYFRYASLKAEDQQLQQAKNQFLNDPGGFGGLGQQPQAQTSVPFVNSQAAYDALPSGAQFREDPNGPILIKE